jgi:hypothetical protein
MSRTTRNIEHACINDRRIRFKSQLTNTSAFIDELLEYSFVTYVVARTRDKVLASRWYLTNWDDYGVSAYHELDFEDGKNTDFDCS